MGTLFICLLLAVAAPRDNVIFKAGFFARSKGHERVLIVRSCCCRLLPWGVSVPWHPTAFPSSRDTAGDTLKPYGKNAAFVHECLNCHKPVKWNDYVFTDWAPVP